MAVFLGGDGIEIHTPHTLAPHHRNAIQKILCSLKNRKNLLLDTPSRSGKTLSILCAVLGWRESPALREKTRHYTTPKALPRVIYTAKTHCQLEHTIRELKKTQYRPRTCIVGSRKQLCLHPGTCQWCSQAKRVRDTGHRVDNVMGMEDLVVFAKKNSLCPHAVTRECLPDAELILLTHAHFFSRADRLDLEDHIDFAGAVVVVDEAHHMDDVCWEHSLAEIETEDLEKAAHCIENISVQKENEKVLFVSNAIRKIAEETEKIPLSGALLVFSTQPIHEILRAAGIASSGAGTFDSLLSETIPFLDQAEKLPVMELKRFLRTAFSHCAQQSTSTKTIRVEKENGKTAICCLCTSTAHFIASLLGALGVSSMIFASGF
ncbi:MAG: uncharacterized protein A8A55_2907, partial [Amphiamblys sp. WSBS2006]